MLGIIAFGIAFFLLIMPTAVAYGVITDKLDIETLEPVEKAQEVEYGYNSTEKSIY